MNRPVASHRIRVRAGQGLGRRPVTRRTDTAGHLKQSIGELADPGLTFGDYFDAQLIY